MQGTKIKKQTLPNSIIEIIPSKLYFVCSDEPVEADFEAYEINIDEVLHYYPFNEDFGPLNLACVYNYIHSLKELIWEKGAGEEIFYHRTATDYKKYTNSVLLICLFQVTVLHKTPQEAFHPFEQYQIPAFRDSSPSKSNYHCTVLHCLEGFTHACGLGWFDINTFDVNKFIYYSQVRNGDISEIVPKKIFGFSSPSQQKKDRYGNQLMTVKDYIPVFRNLDIKVVINLSKTSDFSAQFQKYGIISHNLPFQEGSCPSEKTVREFLEIIESYDENIVIGVYCHAGLGKTGTMIGCYLLKHYKFHAEPYIGWVRLCRPGSVQGSQQDFLKQYQFRLHQSGQSSPLRKKVGSRLLKRQALSLNGNDQKRKEQFSSQSSQNSPETRKKQQRFPNVKRQSLKSIDLQKKQSISSVSSSVKMQRKVTTRSGKPVGFQRIKMMLE